MKRLLAALSALGLFVTLATGARAEKTADPNDHPATQVVIRYLNHALRHEWTEATSLITENSLQHVHRGWIERVKNTSATIDDEVRALELVGKKSLFEVEEMEPAEFYALYHKAMQKRFAMDGERLAEISKSMDVKVLSAGQEGDDLVHILVRTNHVEEDAKISNLELVSLRKTGSGWRVSLNEQGPKLRPVKDR